MSSFYRPRIGISSCLLGETVRWDGGHKRDACLVAVFGVHVEWVPVCPEVEAGFGTPREPMQLVRAPDRTVRLVTTKTGQLETKDALKRRIDEAAKYVDADQLCLSPQCGFASTEEGNILTEEEQWAKLKLAVDIANEVWAR